MRTRPIHSTFPDDGLMNWENRLSNAVLPQPEGPTTATNSPGDISNERPRKTTISPKLSETSSTHKGLSLITPPYTRYLRQLKQHPIDDDPDHSDYNHPANKQIHP